MPPVSRISHPGATHSGSAAKLRAPSPPTDLMPQPNAGRNDDPTKAYWAACLERIGPFVDRHYRFPGVWAVHRAAIGFDLIKAPANVLLAPPALLLQLTAPVLERLGAVGLAHRLRRLPLGFRTAVETAVGEHLRREVLGPDESHAAPAAMRGLIDRYTETRRALSDVSAALSVGFVGLVAADRFTPGSLSAGQELARNVSHYAAVQDFLLGETLGGWFYRFFPPQTPLWGEIVAVIGVAALMAVIAAFSGLVTDPLQARLGLHQARLRRWLRTFRRLVDGTGEAAYRPWDPYLARLVDVVDVVKSVIR